MKIENLKGLLLFQAGISLLSTPSNLEPDCLIDPVEEELEVGCNVVLLVELEHFLVVAFR